MESYTSIFLKSLTFFVLLILFLYLILPIPRFPVQPHDSVQSLESADTETPWRRAYFTNYTREDVLNLYKKQLSKSSFFGISLPTHRLNYPPEEAQLLIRDQTRSTFLEEIVLPFRSSLFINGFVPTQAKDAVGYRGTSYYQKVTIKYVPSFVFLRVLISAFGILAFYFVAKELLLAMKDVIKNWS